MGSFCNNTIIIDKLNRTNIDKVLGQLFTVLSGQSVTLPYMKNESEIELLSAKRLEGYPQPSQYVIPKSWRIFATMNTYDKTSLYEMSYAFMRRFAFIRIGVPTLPEDDGKLEQLMGNYLKEQDNFTLSSGEIVAIGRV